MKSLSLHSSLPGILVLFAAVWAANVSAATTNSVTASGITAYVINGTNNPALTLQRGVTYVFALSGTTIHPFWIKSALGLGSTGRYDNGVTSNGATSGSVSFAVPAAAPDQLFYQCGNHGANMNGPLNIVTPPAPPTVTVVYISVGNFVTVESTGTSGWNPIPEYRGSLNPTNWTPVPSFTNSFANGTNTTSFDRLESLCGSNVFIRIRNQSN